MSNDFTDEENRILERTVGLGLTAVVTNRRAIALACASYVATKVYANQITSENTLTLAREFDEFLRDG